MDLKVLSYALSRTWVGEASGSLVSPLYEVRLIESIVHELAHLAVFNRTHFPRTKFLGRIVEDEFTIYANDYAADISELKAVVVERLVIDDLGIWLDWEKLVKNTGLRRDWSYRARVKKIVQLDERYHDLLHRRARRVRRWIDTALAEYLVAADSFASVDLARTDGSSDPGKKGDHGTQEIRSHLGSDERFSDVLPARRSAGRRTGFVRKS